MKEPRQYTDREIMNAALIGGILIGVCLVLLIIGVCI